MRALHLLLGILLLALASAPHAAALLPAECAAANAMTGSGFAWVPGCVRIVSGDAITFENADAAPHNARSAQDDGPVFRQLAPPCFQTRDFTAGNTAQVRFTHDSSSLTASVRNADGIWGPVRDCTLAEDPTTLAFGEAAINIECGIHQSMTGRIVVSMLG